MNELYLIVGMALVTFSIRYGFIGISRRIKLLLQ
jgi:branched-subunit amino acid transport protein